MSNDELYHGFSPEKQAEHENWLIAPKGEPMREEIKRSRGAWDALGEEGHA